MVMVDRQAEGVCFVFMVVVLLRLAAFDLNRLLSFGAKVRSSGQLMIMAFLPSFNDFKLN